MKTILAFLLLTALGLSAQPTPPGTSTNTAAPPPRLVPGPAGRAARVGTSNAPTAFPAVPTSTAPATPPGPGVVPAPEPTQRAAAPVTTPPANAGLPATGPAPAATNPPAGNPPTAAKPTATPPPEEPLIPAKYMNYTGADLSMVIQKYAELVGRSMLRSPAAEAALKTPVFFVNQTPLTRAETIQAYETIIAMNGVALDKVGEKFLKVGAVAEAATLAQKPVIATSTNDLPEMGQLVTYITQLKYIKPSEMQQLLVQFQSGKIPNAILGIDSSQMLVLRDFTENVKRMLEMIERVDVGAPPEFENEVVPIKFAKAEDIASALSSLSSGGSTSTVGTRSSGTTGGVGVGGGNRLGGGLGGNNYNQGTGLSTPGTLGGAGTGNPSAGGSFSSRIDQIINRAAKSSTGSGEFQIIGPNKIVADVRSNSLMIFASHADMITIKKIIDQLDVVLAQVLIETIILDVTLTDGYSMGVSYLQKKLTQKGDFSGIGGLNNIGFLTDNSFGAATNGAAALGKGWSYLAHLDDSWDVTLNALASDSTVKVVQRPQIMTSHATPAQVFIGSTVPYVSGTYYGGGYGGGPSSSYQQLRVGIQLSVTPFINQEGLVVMKIDEAIDEISGSVPITGVGDVPTTTSRTLSAEVAVGDRQTIVLGGFIRSSGQDNKSGVPVLKDIPLLGYLFNSTSKSKTRNELLVLMRPTVLRTPQLAAAQTDIEKGHLPGIRAAEAESRAEESRRVGKADRALGPSVQGNTRTNSTTNRDAQGFLPVPQ